jgi:hypothetical protein
MDLKDLIPILARFPHTPVIPDDSAPIAVGDIRKATGEGYPRLVVVLAVEGDIVEICLLSNELEMQSEWDVLLPRERTGLPFHLIAETDLSAPLYAHQLGGRIGSVPEDIDLEDRGDSRRGTPIRGETDPRWDWKIEELGELQDLCRVCVCDLLGD